ncbi:hypothetical protein [Sporomusa termitida]|uniref:Uncharacterized protein n=1 Tax=Sporomusa termitida TaxID=2377 RepID=A0A517DTM8_9FIRM|nr:hypothetical protein [Sporomusa termitida]QDR80705.1 hypothetical protein SPTER_20360 [Sporomusa termitida]
MSDHLTPAGAAFCPGLVSFLPAERDWEPQPPGAEPEDPEDRLMLRSILTETFNQYIFVRVDNILKLAGTNDAGYSKTVSKVGATLDRLLALAGELKDQYPELQELVMDYESFTALESGQSAEIAYKQGLRDCSHIQQEFMTFLQQR